MQLQSRKRGLQRSVEITSPLHDSPRTMAAPSLTPTSVTVTYFAVASKWEFKNGAGNFVSSSLYDKRGGLKWERQIHRTGLKTHATRMRSILLVLLQGNTSSCDWLYKNKNNQINDPMCLVFLFSHDTSSLISVIQLPFLYLTSWIESQVAFVNTILRGIIVLEDNAEPTCHRFHRLMHVETVHKPPLVSWLLPFFPRAVISVLWKSLPQASLYSWGYSTLAVGLLNSGQASLFNLCDLKTNNWQSFCSSFWALIWFQPQKVTPYTKVTGHLKLQIIHFYINATKTQVFASVNSETAPSKACHSHLGDKARLHPAVTGLSWGNKQPSTLADNSELPVTRGCVSSECWRKQENLVRSQADTRRTWKPYWSHNPLVVGRQCLV